MTLWIFPLRKAQAAPLHPERREVHRKTGKTHLQIFHLRAPVPAKPKEAPVDITLMSIMQWFSTEKAARSFFEQVRWPNGPVCPHCESKEAYALTASKEKKIRPGLYMCPTCRKQFTVTVGTVMESTRIPLQKWLIGFYMMCSSKTQVSALQLQRQLEIGSYQTALFLCHRIRYALAEWFPEKLEGTVEADETYIGGKAKGMGRAYTGNKTPVVSVVERGGRVRSQVVDKVTKMVIGKLLGARVASSAHLNTDESQVYVEPGRRFASHETVKHKDKEYSRVDPVSGRRVSTNVAEGYFGNTKNSIRGTHHAISPQHTGLYMSELDFKYNTRKMTDSERTIEGIPRMEGKRLTREDLYSRRYKVKGQVVQKAMIPDDEFRMPAVDFVRIMRKVMREPVKPPEDRPKLPLPKIITLSPKKRSA